MQRVITTDDVFLGHKPIFINDKHLLPIKNVLFCFFYGNQVTNTISAFDHDWVPYPEVALLSEVSLKAQWNMAQTYVFFPYMCICICTYIYQYLLLMQYIYIYVHLCVSHTYIYIYIYTVYNSSYAYIGLIDSNSPTGASKPSGDRYTAVPRIINGPPFWRACTVAGRPRAKISGLSTRSVQYLYSIYIYICR